MQLFVTSAFIIITGAVLSIASSECHNQEITGSVDFEVRCLRHGDTYNVKIICHSDDWTKFPVANLNLSSAADVVFVNCSFSVTTNVQRILDSMKIKVNSQIFFEELQSIPQRQTLEDLSAYSNVDDLPFDLLSNEIDIRILKIRHTQNLLKTSDPSDACSETCICRKDSEKRVLAVDCSYRNLTHVPPVIGSMRDWSIELNMAGNMLQHSPSLDDSYLENVTSLDLSNNNITEVKIDLFSPNLQHLRLHGNNISRLDFVVINYLASENPALRSITLHDNKWICDCETRRLLTFVRQNLTSYNLYGMRCNGTGRKIYKLRTSGLCKREIVIMIVAWLSIAFLSIAIGSLAALYHKYRCEFKVWLCSKQRCLRLVRHGEVDKGKKYDAFVSYSRKDQGFVENEIVTRLEGSPRPYKLCLHYRDWPAGELIPVQIGRSVAKSCRTIVVLTPNFLESEWGLLEFRAAHNQALKEGRSHLIVILYGDIGNIEDLDQEMQDYLRLNTYIKWADPWFWDKLRYALPKKSVSRKSRKADFLKNLSARSSSSSSTLTDADSRDDVISISMQTTSTNGSVNLPSPNAENKNPIA